MQKTIYVLGAQDPEMREIQRILSNRGIQFAHAALNSQRCNAMTAYDADSIVLTGRDNYCRPTLLHPKQDVVFVECGMVGIEPSFRIDHHNPGDPGYGVSPDRFMDGSSLGQFLTHIGEEPNETQRLLAAADHCLTAAYQGQCPGVDPDELLFLRAAWQAIVTSRSLSQVVDGILRAAKQVNARFNPETGESVFKDPTTNPQDLPEGAAYAGKPVRYRSFRDGYLKEMFKGGTPEAIEAFMEEHRQLGHKTYGNPYRGYAGAYIA